jgi:hypothetical protein
VCSKTCCSESQLLNVGIGGLNCGRVLGLPHCLRNPVSSSCILRLSEVTWRRCVIIALLSAVLAERISLRAKREISALRVTASVDMVALMLRNERRPS